jgi:two-component system chemotaxis response regulator CheY
VVDAARESRDRRVVSLVVDDYDDARATVREMLEELGHEVVEAENGQQAFDYVISHPEVRVQLIVLDLRMPVMNGLEFLALMRSYVRLSRIPIVVASGSVSSLDAVEVLGLAGCIQAPYEVPKLRAIVEGLRVRAPSTARS